MSEYEVGYGKPPKSGQIRKGEVRNPSGRRGNKPKPPPLDNSPRAILERLENELVEFQGRMITKREARLTVLYHKAMKGDPRSIAMLEKLLAEVNVDTPRGGVLVVPAAVPLDEWEASVARQQAPHRQVNVDYEALDRELLENLTAKG